LGQLQRGRNRKRPVSNDVDPIVAGCSPAINRRIIESPQVRRRSAGKLDVTATELVNMDPSYDVSFAIAKHRGSNRFQLDRMMGRVFEHGEVFEQSYLGAGSRTDIPIVRG
jgi:hypothetical protein